MSRRARPWSIASALAIGLAGCAAEPAPPAALTAPAAGARAPARPDDPAAPPDASAPPPADPPPRNEPAPGSDSPPSADAGVDASAEAPCNGHPALCDRRFDQVVFPAAHNAMSNADDLWFIPDQTHNMSRQLRDGIRALLIDTYLFNGGGFLCHTSCAFGNRPLVDGLKDVAEFLRDNPREVLALLIEDYLSAAETEKAFMASGLQPFLYIHPAGQPWPTLGEMIARGQRLLVLAQNGHPPPPWYHGMWELLWDTPYTFKNETEFSCSENRGKRGNDLFLLNHWLENPVPDPRLSATANARDLLLARARQCQQESGKLPNFVAVNHYSLGALFEVVRALNGLDPAPPP